MKIKEQIIVGLLVLILAHSLFLAHFHTSYFVKVWTREDGFIEWLTVLALLSGALLSFYRAVRLRNVRSWLFVSASVLLGLLFIFGAGEEISWGQRLLNVKSSAFFLKHNSQGETNLHNIVVGGVKINKLFFGLFLSSFVAFYLLVLPVLYKKFESIKKISNTFALPIARWYHVVLYLLVFFISEATLSGKKGEIIEFGGCWVFFMMWLNPYNHNIFNKN
jgi:hypothetical protein